MATEGLVKILCIPRGMTCDVDGYELGDDWLLADLGCDRDDNAWYVVTNRVHASEFGYFDEVLGPEAMAKIIVEAVNQKAQEVYGGHP